MLDREISEFGRRMGMPGFALSADNGVAALDVHGLGRVYFERHEEELLIYLSSPALSHDSELPRRVLRLCGYQHAHPQPLYGGVHAGQVVLLTRVPERALTAAVLETSVAFLGNMLQQIVR